MSPSASWLVKVAVSVWPVVGRARRDRDACRPPAPCWPAVTVQVNVSVVGERAVADGDGDAVRARRRRSSVPLMTPVAGADRDAGGQARGAVGQRVAVGVGRVGVEARRRAPIGVGAVAEVGAEDGRAVGDGDGLEVSGALVRLPSLTVTRTRMRSPLSPLPARGEVERRAGGARDVGAVARPLVARW